MVNPHVRDNSSLNVHGFSNIPGQFYIISLPSQLISMDCYSLEMERCQGVKFLGSEAHMRDPGDWCSNVTSPVDWLHNSINPFLHCAWTPHLVKDYYENPFFLLYCEVQLLFVKNSETFLGKKKCGRLVNVLVKHFNFEVWSNRSHLNPLFEQCHSLKLKPTFCTSAPLSCDQCVQKPCTSQRAFTIT